MRLVLLAAACLLLNVSSREAVAGAPAGPAKTTAPAADASTATTAAVFGATADLSAFNRLLRATASDRLLARPGATYTVFAPTNAAIDRVPAYIQDRLFRPEAPGLRRLVRTHLVAGTLDLAALPDGAEIKTLSGETLRLAKRPDGELLLNGVYRISRTQSTANGIVYTLDSMIAAGQ